MDRDGDENEHHECDRHEEWEVGQSGRLTSVVQVEPSQVQDSLRDWICLRFGVISVGDFYPATPIVLPSIHLFLSSSDGQNVGESIER